MQDTPPPPSPDFEEQELLDAFQQGHLGKSVGIDGVSLELLKEINNTDRGKKEILKWFNLLLYCGELPPHWLD